MARRTAPVEYLPDTKPWTLTGNRCIGVVRSRNSEYFGQRCRKRPRIGLTVCGSHGGAPAHAVKAGRERRAREDLERELTQMGEAIEGVDPTTALLGLVCEWAGNVAFLRRKVQQLEQRWVGRDHVYELGAKDAGEPGEGIVGPNHLGDGAPHIYLAMYGEACDRLAKYSKMAIEAGIVERQVRIAEEQGELIAQVLRGVLADMNIPASPKLLESFRKHLALASASSLDAPSPN